MSINQKHFGLSDSLVNAVNEALKGKQHAIDVAEPKGKITGADFKKLRGEGAKPDFIDIDKDGNKTEPMKKASKEIKEDDAHFEKQSKKMQDAINMHLRKGKSYSDAAKAAKMIVKEEALDEKAVSQAQQKAAGAALATQRGEYAGGKKGGAVNRMALMKRAELEKIASTKRKGLPMRKEEVVDEGNAANKEKKNAAAMAVGAKNRDAHYLRKINPPVADKIRGREKMSGKDRQWFEEVEVTEADDAVSKQIAAKKDAMKKQIQQKIAQKQMSTMQAKANKRLSSINASNDSDKEDEKEMKKGGKEKIEINPALRD